MIKDYLKKKPKNKTILVRIPEDKKTLVQVKLKKNGLSFNQLIIAAIDQYLREK